MAERSSRVTRDVFQVVADLVGDAQGLAVTAETSPDSASAPDSRAQTQGDFKRRRRLRRKIRALPWTAAAGDFASRPVQPLGPGTALVDPAATWNMATRFSPPGVAQADQAIAFADQEVADVQCDGTPCGSCKVGSP